MQLLAQADLAKQSDVPPGGCMPIGLTASGEMVFPLLCRDLLEKQRGPIVQDQPATLSKSDAAPLMTPAEKITAAPRQSAPDQFKRPARKKKLAGGAKGEASPVSDVTGTSGQAAR